ncbi:hypothetical protein CFIMG_000251RA [Ceratocystis fimbriata CBS 114723]|uniref:Fibronectin type-III domain-containing protein n=1 Tax=Ceratocystis fimbriata CBS 114723 TaxID=1035309 RepID=A0A2C5XJP7_9PEZI|nr:hypothetical protein CFIMG_000251RA [Ceratocystis fimbriata CBS 114723]
MTWWWSQLFLKFTLIGTVILCRFHRPPRAPTAFDNFTHTLIFVSTFWSVWSRIAEIVSSYLDFATLAVNVDSVLVDNVKMFVTLMAFIWLATRSIQTLSTPTPVLIKTLNVEVPEAPDVSLSEIKSDAATLQWARPSPTRTVLRFLIQVNGVNVGESSAQETAITVTGLKPGHFYNIRVIAVGPNNFQVSSPVIRLQTYDVNCRPVLAGNKLPSSFCEQECRSRITSSSKSTVIGVETAAAAAADSTPTNSRDIHTNTNTTTQRRNTLNRKPSPSVTSSDQPVLKDIIDKTDVSLQELNDKFERTRCEIEETVQQYKREEDDFKQQEADLKSELAEKKRLNKERDAKTEQLRKQMRTAMELKRAADKEKAKKEQILKDKEAKLEAIHLSISKLEASILDMKSKRKSFEEDGKTLDDDHKKKIYKLDGDNAKLTEECAALEASLKQKGKTVKAMKLERHALAVGEDDDFTNEVHAKVIAERDATKRELENRIKTLTTQGHKLEVQYQNIRLQNESLSLHQHQLQQGSMAGNYGQTNATNTTIGTTATATPASVAAAATTAGPVSEFEHQIPLVAQQQNSLRSRHGSNNISESPPIMQFPLVDTSAYAMASGYQQSASFPYIDMPATTESYASDDGFTPVEYRHAPSGPPLSPTATSLLPSGILGDCGDVNNSESDSPLASNVTIPSTANTTAIAATPPIADSQSPTGSNGSPSLLSSPHESSGNLPFPTLGSETPDRSSLVNSRDLASGNNSCIGQSQPQHQSQHQRFTSLFSFPRHNPRTSVDDADFGMPFGSLRSSQSQSLPRQSDGLSSTDQEKKTTFSLFGRNTIHNDSSDVFGAVGSNRVATRMHNPYSTSGNLILGSMHERDPSSPRPSSIASAELPRPSTEIGSPWGSGDTSVGPSKNRPWPTESRWHNTRSASRRTSVHNANASNGSSAFFATEDDDILDESDLQKLPAHKVGVIGSRPSNSQNINMSPSASARLNPNAPTFMATAFHQDVENERADNRNRSRAMESKVRNRSPTQVFYSPTQTSQRYHRQSDDMYGGFRRSVDAISISANAKNLASSSASASAASASHDALSQALDSSSDPVDHHQDNNGLMKLFRKGSSSRFSLSSRLSKDPASLFKKAPGASGTSALVSAALERKATVDTRTSLNSGTEDCGHGLDEGFVFASSSSAPTASLPALVPAAAGSGVVGDQASYTATDIKDREKEGRMASWRFSMSKKRDRAATGKANVDVERDAADEE